MNIKGKFVTIRAIEKEDLELLQQMFNDPYIESCVVCKTLFYILWANAEIYNIVSPWGAMIWNRTGSRANYCKEKFTPAIVS